MKDPPYLREMWGGVGLAAFGVCLLAELLGAARRAALAATPRLGRSHHLTGLIPGVVSGNARCVPCDSQTLLRLLGLLLRAFHFLTSFFLDSHFFLFGIDRVSRVFDRQDKESSFIEPMLCP